MRRLLAALAPVIVVGCATAPSSETEASAALAVLSVLSGSELDWPAPQGVFDGYGEPVRDALWIVYADGGTELYCRTSFAAADSAAHRVGSLALSWEHAYPANKAADALGYADRDCTDPLAGEAEPPDLCLAATGDLHNLWPAFQRINSSRGDHPYGELPGEGTTNPNFQPFCADYERAEIDDVVFVEPTEEARGDLARSLIYMHEVYGLPLEAVIADPAQLSAWISEDPVDSEEEDRERAIRAAQGTWNPLVLPPEE